jgi:hypothetical protein
MHTYSGAVILTKGREVEVVHLVLYNVSTKDEAAQRLVDAARRTRRPGFAIGEADIIKVEGAA